MVQYVREAFSTRRVIVSVGWSIYPLSYFFGYLSGAVGVSILRVVCETVREHQLGSRRQEGRLPSRRRVVQQWNVCLHALFLDVPISSSCVIFGSDLPGFVTSVQVQVHQLGSLRREGRLPVRRRVAVVKGARASGRLRVAE